MGEDVNHFGCYVGGKLVLGTFPGISFEEGDEVKVSAKKLDDQADYVHAVVRTWCMTCARRCCS